MFRPSLFRILRSLLLMISLVAFSACESQNSVPSGSKYVVSANKTAFYKFGPAQSFGPDFVLNEGARVTMLEHTFGYSRVMTEDGTAGFVSTDDIKPAPVSYATSRNVSTNYTAQLKRPLFEQPKAVEKHSNVPSNSSSPLFDQGDTPLPQNSEAPKRAPGFRY
jgi:hypothetical protein